MGSVRYGNGVSGKWGQRAGAKRATNESRQEFTSARRPPYKAMIELG